MGGACSAYEEMNAYKILVGKSEGKRPLGKPRHGWEDNIKMDVKDVSVMGVNWICLVQEGTGSGLSRTR
jgi:hypothetical protein